MIDFYVCIAMYILRIHTWVLTTYPWLRFLHALYVCGFANQWIVQFITINTNKFGQIPLVLVNNTNVTRFAKRVLYMHFFKTHFSSPFDNYTNGPTAYVFNTAESWSVCFQTQTSFSRLSDVHECLGHL